MTGSDVSHVSGSDVTRSHVTFPLNFPRTFPYFFPVFVSRTFFPRILLPRTFFFVPFSVLIFNIFFSVLFFSNYFPVYFFSCIFSLYFFPLLFTSPTFFSVLFSPVLFFPVLFSRNFSKIATFEIQRFKISVSCFSSTCRYSTVLVPCGIAIQTSPVGLPLDGWGARMRDLKGLKMNLFNLKED